jgi:hypothetical protein
MSVIRKFFGVILWTFGFACLFVLLYLSSNVPENHYSNVKQDLQIFGSQTLSEKMASLSDSISKEKVEKDLNVEIEIVGSAICVYSKDSNDSLCYTKVFKPSYEFKPVYWSQTLPPGLEIKMDLSGSGKRFAKLMGKKKTVSRKEVNVPSHGLSKAHQAIIRLRNAYVTSAGDDTIVLKMLEDVLAESNSLKAGIEIAENDPIAGTNEGSLDFLIHLFMTGSDKISIKVGAILGTAVLNNKVAKSLIPVSFLDKVLVKLKENPSLRSEWLFFISNWVRDREDLVEMLFEPETPHSRIEAMLNWKIENDFKYRQEIRIIELVTDCLRLFIDRKTPSTEIIRSSDKVLRKWGNSIQGRLIAAVASKNHDSSLGYLRQSGTECVQAMSDYFRKYSELDVEKIPAFKSWERSGFAEDFDFSEFLQ